MPTTAPGLSDFTRTCHCGLPAALASVAVAAAILPAHADLLSLPNNSFESPTAPATYPYVTINVDSWVKNPEPEGYNPANFGGIAWVQTAGTFGNDPLPASDYIDNMDGNQAAYFINFPSVGLSQVFSIFQAGNSYSFTLAAIGGGHGMSLGSTLDISLFYLDGTNTPVMLATTPIVYSDSTASTNHFVDYSVSVPTVQPGDAWAGQPLGIAIDVPQSDYTGDWDIDNARVVSAPEPASFAMLALGGVLLAHRRRRA